MEITDLKAPFPWFGGKSRVAQVVWDRFGDVHNYVEPFAGSLAVLLARPKSNSSKVETVNDIDGYICNFWRAVSMAAEEVWEWADCQPNECELEARHLWLLERKEELRLKLGADPDYYCARTAGYWVYGICLWIGGGFCSGKGPWKNVNGVLARAEGVGVTRQIPHLGDAGKGINGITRKLPHVGDAGRGINRKLPHLGDAGNGINRTRPHLGGAGQGINRKRPHLGDAGPLTEIAKRLRNVRVCCGDWSRVVGPTPTHLLAVTGVFLDPPYSVTDRESVYNEESFTVAKDVAKWCLENGDNPRLRIALCGYAGEHELPGWIEVAWTTLGGYGNQGKNTEQGRKNRAREVIWFSPHCLKSKPIYSIWPD